MDQQSAISARVTDTDNPNATDIATQHSTLGPNDVTHNKSKATTTFTTDNENLVTPQESQMAESKQQFMSDSKEDPKTEIDFSSNTRMSLQSNPNTKDVGSLSTSYTQQDENDKNFNVAYDKSIKDASGSSGPSFVVLPMRTNDEQSSTMSLCSMPDLSGQLSLPSVLSSLDASSLYSGEYIRSQVKYYCNQRFMYVGYVAEIWCKRNTFSRLLDPTSC